MVVIKLKNIKGWEREKKTDKFAETDNYYIDGILKSNIDSLIYNLPFDWDFVITVSGNNMVRVGKSVLAQQIGAYAAEKLNTPWSINNITMTSKEMIDFALKAPKHSVIIYDEAAEGLRAAKNAKDVLDSLLDFFDECGQLNHLFIIVAPNFFRLKSDITIERSELLLNVYRIGSEARNELGETVIKLQRGFFQFFDREQKRKLFERYIKTKTQSYSGMTDTVGHFREVYTIEPEAYKEKKKKTLRLLKVQKPIYYKNQFNKLLIKIKNFTGLSAQQLKEKFEIDIDKRQIQSIIKAQVGHENAERFNINNNSIKEKEKVEKEEEQVEI